MTNTDIGGVGLPKKSGALLGIEEVNQIREAFAAGLGPEAAAGSIRTVAFPDGVASGSLRYLLLRSGITMERIWYIRRLVSTMPE